VARQSLISANCNTCLGPVDKFDDKSLLDTTGWAKRENIQALVFENSWKKIQGDR